jgi:hypothetical protein
VFILTYLLPGVIERGHIYFFYRPKVEHEEAHDLDDVQRFSILLVPRPPAFATGDEEASEAEKPGMEIEGNDEMKLIEPGADAVPAPAQKTAKKKFRIINVGKKQLPDPEHAGRKDAFWAIISSVGQDLSKIGEELGSKDYETKTRGMFAILPFSLPHAEIIIWL